MLAGDVDGDAEVTSSTDDVVVSAFGLCCGVVPPPATGLKVVVSGGLADAELIVRDVTEVVGEATT